MKPIGARAFRVRPLSRRRLLRNGAALGTVLVMSGFPVLGSGADRQSAMDMNGHAAGPDGVPRAPFDRDAPLVDPEVRRSDNGKLETALRIGDGHKNIGG